jgi:hypothetical protein
MSVNLSKTHIVLAEANALKAEIDRLTAEYRARTALLATLVGNATGKHSTESGSFTVSENNTYDEAAMREALSPGQVRRCSVARLDKAAVKRLYPAVYAAAKRENGVKVSLG